jgi:hypothetical protein
VGNTPNVVDFSKTLTDFLNDAVAGGTWNQIVGSILKFDDPGDEAQAADIDAAAGQLWANLLDDYFRATYPFFYTATKVWVVADPAARDALGSDDGLAVDDIAWVQSLKAFWYVVSVDGPTSSTWLEVMGSSSTSAVGMRWEFDTGTADADPGAGKWRYNNATQSAATFIYINNDCFDGIGFRNFFLDLLNDDFLFLQSEVSPTQARRWLMNGVADATPGTYVRIPITFPPATSQGTDFAGGNVVRFYFNSIVEGIEAVLRRNNRTSGQDLEMSAGDRIFAGANPVAIEADTADTGAVLALQSTLTNGETANFFVGDRDPIGNVTGSPGDFYVRVGGTASRLYQHVGSVSNNTNWIEFGQPTAPGPRWFFDSSTVDADPGVGKFRLNNASQAAATFIYIDNDCFDAVALDQITSALDVGAGLYLQQETTPIKNKSYDVTGPAVVAAGYVKIPVAIASGTQGTDLDTDKTIRFEIYPSGAGNGGGLAFTALKTGAYTAVAGDLVKYDPTSGTFTLTFPASPSADDRVGFKNASASTVAVTLAGNGNTVENPASYGVAASQSVSGNGLALTYQFDGTSWLIV